jgi:hypothetical protein
MIWLLPAAFTGLLLLAGPIAIHLLTRRSARRMPFPTIRFLRESRSTAVRPRKPSDLGLLLLRLTIVGAAVAAAAQPLIVTPFRVAQWNARIVRAIVIDTSDSMRQPDQAGHSASETAAAIAHSESGGAVQTVRIETSDLHDGLLRAVRQLDRVPPARREIVVVSDFQQGTVNDDALAVVPGHVGLRFLRTGRLPTSHSWNAGAIEGWRGGRWDRAVTIDRSSTTATWTRVDGTGSPQGLTIVAPPAEDRRARTALAAAASFGANSDADARKIVIAFQGAPRPDPFSRAQTIHTAWIVKAAEALANSELIQQALDATDLTGAQFSEPWMPFARDARGRGAVTVAEDDGAMLIQTSAPVSSLFAPALIRAALLAREDPAPNHEREVLTIADAQLARWQRAPGAVTSQSWSTIERSDARWFWLATLLLLGVETMMRRARAPRAEEPHVRAA